MRERVPCKGEDIIVGEKNIMAGEKYVSCMRKIEEVLSLMIEDVGGRR